MIKDNKMTNMNALNLSGSSTDGKYFTRVTITPKDNVLNTEHTYIDSDKADDNTSTMAFRLNLEQRATRQLQRRIILLWSAQTKYQYKKTPLAPNEKEALDLWQHVSQCSDKGCRRKHCHSSRYAMAHYMRCKRSNRSLTCKACAPVTKYIAREQSSIKNRGNKSENKEKTRLKRKNRTMLCDIDENKPFTGYESMLGLQCTVCKSGNYDERMTPERSFGRSCIDLY